MDDHTQAGFSFPSSDGFNIVMDFTAVWGLMLDQAAMRSAVRNVDLVEPRSLGLRRSSMRPHTAVKSMTILTRRSMEN